VREGSGRDQQISPHRIEMEHVVDVCADLRNEKVSKT
jgi:hypothetical protein